MSGHLAHHHLGIACRDIELETAAYDVLDYRQESPDFIDPLQGVRGRFLVGPGPRVELLQQLDGSDVLEPWLTRGSCIYHQAFEIGSLDECIRDLERSGAFTVRAPMPATAFAGRPIAFVMLRNLALVELIQAEVTG